MLTSEREKVRKAAEEGAYMSIAVNADGTPTRGCFIPWEQTASAYNMKLPKVTLAVADLSDPVIMGNLRKCNLCGLYIFVPLENYEFISSFRHLRDVFICHGQNLHSLSFINGLTNLFMFYLEDATLPDLEALVDVFNEGRDLPGKCMGFYHCQIGDTSAFEKAKFITSELLIWPVEGDARERWKFSAMRMGTFRFYTGK